LASPPVPALPAPPDRPDALSPLVDVWQSGRPLIRCHDVCFGATEFNPGIGSGRFHPITGREGRSIPTLYGADCVAGALSETVFHDVPVRGPERAILRTVLRPLLLSSLTPGRDLNLAQLHGFGLGRLGVTRAELIDSAAEHYEQTAAWARALHQGNPRLDGLVWDSRQHDDAQAVLLFGDRVSRRDLSVDEPPLVLYSGRGFDVVQAAAEKAGILVLL
jgi:hypothetical protein